MDRDAYKARGRHLWAKSSKSGTGHSLLGHLLDVGLVADELLKRRHQRDIDFLAAEIGSSSNEARQLAVVMAALHDIGKATPVFQAKWPSGAPPEAMLRNTDEIPHGRASGIILRAWLIDRGIHPRLASSMANAVAIHHGSRLPATFAALGTYDPRSIGEDSVPWTTWRAGLIGDVEASLGPMPSLSAKNALRGRGWALLAGLTSVADWIGSSLSHWGEVEDVQEYNRLRSTEIGERLDEISWASHDAWWKAPDTFEGFESWFGSAEKRFHPRPLQTAVSNIVHDDDQPSLLIVEAPMGEGKTEVAFYAMVQPSAAPGAFFGLPTQATSDAMQTRLQEFVTRNQAEAIEVALAHSAAAHTIRVRNESEPDDRESADSESIAESWFSGGRRELLAKLGAGTIDQALLAVLPVRHFFIRLWGLAGKTVVFDEVHAYDAYTGGLIIELIRWLAAVGSSVVVMSATLPSSLRASFAAAFSEGLGEEEGPTLPSLEYPRATRVTGSKACGLSFAASRSARVSIAAAPYQTEQLADEVISSVASGGAVVAIVNTVNRAQELYQVCKSRGVSATLLHARFPLDERKRLEQVTVKKFGKDGVASGRAGLVIATQVVEQSLDLDFDVMYTDLAPVDLVLQRAGRLHRHDRTGRPADHWTPVLHISGLTSAQGAGPERDALETVYDQYVLWRSWAILSRSDSISIPNDIDDWVQIVYGESSLDELRGFESAVGGAKVAFETKRRNQAEAAKNWALGGPLSSAMDSWGESGRDQDEHRAYDLKVPTRLGDDSITVIPIVTNRDGWTVFGATSSLNRRASRAGKAFVDAAVSRQIRVARKSLVARLRSQELPVWWTPTGALRYFYPLFLDGDCRAQIDASVWLSNELGLVYERSRQ